MSTRRIGVAVGHDGVWALPLGRQGTRSRALRRAAGTGSDLSGSSLRDAVRSVVEELRAEGGLAHVAILPPLAQLRQVEVPDLDDAELPSILQREAGRYFFGARESQLVGIPVGVKTRSAPVRTLVAATPRSIIEDVLAALRDERVEVATISCAYDSWCAAVAGLVPSVRRGVAWLVVCLDDEIDVVRCDRGVPTYVRRTPCNQNGTSRLKQILEEEFAVSHSLASQDTKVKPGSGRSVALVGPRETIETTADVIHSTGASLLTLGEDEIFRSPGVLAASGAADVPSSIEFVPDTLASHRRRKAARLTAGLIAAAVAVFALTAGLALWGAHRESSFIADRRAEIAAQVEQAMAQRTILLDLTDRLHTLNELERTAPRWSLLLSQLAEYLPEDAHLTAFRSTPDSLWLEGIAGRPADIVHAMENAPAFLAVRAQTPIRSAGDGEPVEQFRMAAQLAPHPGAETHR